MIKTYSFDDGKYEFDRDQAAGRLTAVRRNDEHWPAGWDDFQFSKVIHAMLNRIDELEDRFFFVKDAPGAWQSTPPSAVQRRKKEQMSSAKTPEAAMRESVYQEGQRAFIGNGPCPYSDWRAKTWAKGFDAARAYYAETLAQDQQQAEEQDGLQPCPFCGGAGQ